jgi:hypothetical protein
MQTLLSHITKGLFLLTMFLSVFSLLDAREIHPGGVLGESYWTVRADASFDGSKDRLSFPLQKNGGKQMSVFVVYKNIDKNAEQTVWSVENTEGTSLVMTTRRLGNLQQYNYINYSNLTEPEYRIFSYTVNDAENSGESHILQIGAKPDDKALPVSSFKGYIPEIIIFERVLNPVERQKVETYLAVKYAISLSQVYPTSYFASDNAMIWDANRQRQFKHRITATGRDDVSDLLKETSSSSRESRLLTMELAETVPIPDKNFLFRADNDGALRFFEQNGTWKVTERQWKTDKFGTKEDWTVNLQFDLKHFSNRYLKDEQRYALMIDGSGTGTFPIEETVFVEGNCMNDIVRFSGLEFYSGGKGDAVFALAAVPPNFVFEGLDSNYSASAFDYLYCYPNPSRDGCFWLDLGLKKVQDVEMALYDISGKIIDRTKFGGSSCYIYQGKLPKAGAYILQILTDGKRESIQLIMN